MPYPNQHSARIVDPEEFEKNSFRTKEVAPGVSIIVGKKTGSNSMSVQAYRFDAAKFSFEQVKTWLKKHEITPTETSKATGNHSETPFNPSAIIQTSENLAKAFGGSNESLKSLGMTFEISVDPYSINMDFSEEDKKEQKNRCEKYGIAIRNGGNINKPSQYSALDDSQFADPVNYSYPIDSPHITSTFKNFDQKFYNDTEKDILWKRIIAALPENLKSEAQKVYGITDNDPSVEYVRFDDGLSLMDEIADASETEFSEIDNSYIEKDALLFEIGNKKGRIYTVKDLDSVVNQFIPPETDKEWDVPVQTDHSNSSWHTVGYVKKVWHDGINLYGRLKFLGKQAVEKVASNLWKKLSVGLRIVPETKLREVTVTPFPYVEKAALYSEFSEKGDKIMADEIKEVTTTPEPEVVIEEKKDEEVVTPVEPEVVASVEPEVVKDEVVAPVVENSEPEKPATTKNFDDEMARLKSEYDEKTKALEMRLQEQETIIKFKEASDWVVKFMEKAKIAPANKEDEFEFIQMLDENQLAKYTNIKNNQPEVVVFGKQGQIDTFTPPTAEMTEEKIKKEAGELLASIGYKESDGKFSR